MNSIGANVATNGKAEAGLDVFTGRTAKEENASVPISEISNLKEPTDLVFEKIGTGRLYYRSRLTYASTESPMPPLEEGFTINKTYEQFDKDKKGDNFQRGDIVRVHLEFVLPSARRYIVIHDYLPAGLEAINFSLYTAQRQLKADMNNKYYFNHLEIYGDKVLIFANYLPAGAYQFDYLAKVSTKGDFAVPPVKIEEMYNPEVFGRSMSGRMEIR